MTEQTKEVYGILLDILKNVWEQQKYAETKNGVLLTLKIGIFVLLIKVYIYIPHDIWSKSFFAVLMFLYIVHILMIIQSFFPNDSKKEEIKWTNDEINIFFFGDIKKLKSEKYLNLVIEKLKVDSTSVDQASLLDLSNQIVRLSEIAQYKYTAFKDSIIRMYWLVFFFSIYFLYIFVDKLEV